VLDPEDELLLDEVLESAFVSDEDDPDGLDGSDSLEELLELGLLLSLPR